MRCLPLLSCAFFLLPLACGDGDSPPENTPEDSGQEADTSSLPDTELTPACDSSFGPPRVETLAPGLHVAIGYDLANTILLQTDEGNVVIDVSMSPARATVVREALMAVAPGPTRAIIYTHSHVDHVGGASVWAEEGTEIWATEDFFEHLIKQYGAFRGAEVRRAQLQFGQGLSTEDLPCTAIGPRPDVLAALETGTRKPTHTFSGSHSMEIGGITIELIEAHGETHDQLFVWIPSLAALMPGDNYYATFPNLYSIRGVSPRPIQAWIRSLDEMRRRDPKILAPSHTRPILGRDHIRQALQEYRDAIQWVHVQVVQGANRLDSIDHLANTIQLPPHLASAPALAEHYGQLDWSVRALYTNALGWFDGRAERLYPPANVAAREIELMGGADKVLAAAQTAREEGEPRWASHLLGKLRDSGEGDAALIAQEMALALRALGETRSNTNGRAYLLQTAQNLEQGPLPLNTATLDDALLDELPLTVFFGVMATRLIPDMALDVHESLEFYFTDTEERFFVTVRYGVVEIASETAFADTPTPVAELTTDSGTWRRLTLQLLDPIVAVSDGSLVATDLGAVLTFLSRFDQEL